MLTNTVDEGLVAQLRVPAGMWSCFGSAHGYSFLNSQRWKERDYWVGDFDGVTLILFRITIALKR
jgi:hypothetical protein